MSKVVIKSAEEIALMRESGHLLADVFAYLDPFVKEGVTTMQINDLVERYIVDVLQARPSSKGQYDYPYVLNASVNEVVCHGFPSEACELKSGDIVNIDITLEKNGYLADSSKMYMVGQVSPLAKSLVDTTQQALWLAIKMVKPGVRLGDIGNVIASFVHQRGYSVVKEYCGHGIGQQMHEEPQVLHYGKRKTGLVLKEGMTFTIEPMINQGSAKVKTKADGWTVVTRDKKLSAQWEHTLAVTAHGVEVLTLRDEEKHVLNN